VAAIVDTEALLSVVVASLVAGIGLTSLFSIVIFTATRSAELRRAGNWVAATVLTALAGIGLLGCAALVGFGIQIMASK
jgi:hypothetical protein